jgi:hypothetical protein
MAEDRAGTGAETTTFIGLSGEMIGDRSDQRQESRLSAGSALAETL